NAYVLKANANTALGELFAPRSLSRTVIMFPDPWYKPRHLKRRVVHPKFLAELAVRLCPGAELHIATDQPSLAADMRSDLLSAAEYKNKYPDYAPENFAGLLTDIEQYNRQRGRQIYRLVFIRQ
ncbi:tRNA (guanosine(46)-N7)-methyltransferase TrmB, partial [Candidatus Termititenax persephonae]